MPFNIYTFLSEQKANVAAHVMYVTARSSVTRLVKLASY